MLEAVAAASELVLVAVVTTPARPAGRRGEPRSTAVAQAAATLGTPVLTPERLRDSVFLTALGDLRPAVGVLADYGKILPAAVLDMPPHGILNVHPSLLPRHRGATPIPAAILAADPEVGVSIIRMDAGLDTGPLVAAERTPLGPNEDAPALEGRLARLGAGLLNRCVGPYLQGAVVPVPQVAEGATLTRPLSREDGRMDPSWPAVELERRVRAFRPWPGTFVDLAGGGRLAVLRAAVAPSQAGDRQGTLVADDDGLALAAVDGRLRLLEVRPAGGRAMDGPAYRRGHPGVVGWRVA